MDFSEQELYEVAKSLKSDEGENLEYDRALIELIAYVTGEDVAYVASKLGEEVNVPEELK